VSVARLLQLARSRRSARTIGFGWGFAEGIAFFIVPDVYITFATLFSIRAGISAWLFSILGSLTAVVVIYLLVAVLAVPYVGILDAIPGITRGLLQQTAAQLSGEGLPYTPFLIFGGVPLKVYAALATLTGTSLGALLLWTVFARVVRIAPAVALVATVRALFGASVDSHPARWMAAHVTIWTGFYIFYFMQMAKF
jgi:hypothetical protein